MHLTVEDVEAALIAVQDTALPDKPDESACRAPGCAACARRRSVRSAPDPEKEGNNRLRTVLGIAIAPTAIWVATWPFPVTLMVAMAWG